MCSERSRCLNSCWPTGSASWETITPRRWPPGTSLPAHIRRRAMCSGHPAVRAGAGRPAARPGRRPPPHAHLPQQRGRLPAQARGDPGGARGRRGHPCPAAPRPGPRPPRHLDLATQPQPGPEPPGPAPSRPGPGCRYAGPAPHSPRPRPPVDPDHGQQPRCDLRGCGEAEAARDLDTDTLARRRRVLGDDHPKTLASASNLAKDLEQLGDHQAAAALRAEVTHRRRGQGEAAQANQP